MKKKLLAMLLAAVMVMTLLPTAFALSGSSTGGGGSIRNPPDITWSYSDGVLTIGGTGYMPDYVLGYYEDEEMPWKDHSGETRTVVIGNGITSIGMNAFNGFESLTSVTIPSSVTVIGEWAFYGCTSLTSVTIPASVTEIKVFAFSDCTGLTDVYYGGNESQWGAILGSTEDWEEATFADGGQIGPGLGNVKAHYSGTGPETTQPETSFTDVPDWAGGAANWAVENNVTNGTGGDQFTPYRTCTHGEIITFLWRAAGKPVSTVQAPVTTEPYDDFRSAVNWAYEEGIINADFQTSAPCTRADAVSYIWQALDEQSEGVSSFTDVDDDADYAEAVSWAVGLGITNGTGDGTTFSPDETCTRVEIVTFLHRAYVSEVRLNTNG